MKQDDNNHHSNNHQSNDTQIPKHNSSSVFKYWPAKQ